MSDLSCSTLRELLATIPVSNIHFLGEDSVIRKDTITVDEVNVLSQTTLDALFEAWTQLRSIMAQHETTLNKRWLKRTINQRKEILSRAWPRMPPMHRPDFELLRKGQQSKKTEFSTDDALQFPHINMEDLSQAKPLLFMLDSRSRNPPSIFTNADRDSIHIGLRFKKLVPKYIHGYTMYLNGEQTHETYGRLVSWEQDPQAILKCQSGAAPDPGMGLMILGIQRDVLQFLVRCSAAILHDIPIADLIGPQTESFAAPSTPQPRIASPATPSIISTVEHGSLAAHVLEAPYRAPDAYDFARLRSLVEAKCCEVQDHFLLIREDPGYFAELIREECGHTVEAILNRQYKPHSTPLSEDAWNIAISQVLLTAYREAFMWEAVSGLFHQLIVRYTEQKVNMQPGQVLPDAYVKASSCLEFLLNSVIFSCLQPLPDHMSAVPTFKTLMSHKPCGNGKYEFDMQEKPDDYLYWLFTQLLVWYNIGEETCGLPNILLEMETLIARDQRQRKRLSWRLVRMISDLAVMAEMQRQLSLSRFNEDSLSARSALEHKAWLDNRMMPLAQMTELFQGDTGLASLVTDLRVFDYPSDKPRTAATTATMRSAEQALDRFWEKVDQHVVDKTGKTLSQLAENTVQYRDIQRTPAWADLPPFMEKGEHAGKATDSLDVSLALAMLEERTESTVNHSQPLPARQKVKTRGLPAPSTQAETPDLRAERAGSTTNVEVPRVKVQKKAFNTFAALFGKKAADKLPGELPWNDFKKAMVNIGFSAEKLQGSAWLFKPADSGLNSIIFHEPHPESKLPMQWARRIARRLNRNFGWTADTFVPEKATSEENAQSASS